MAKKQLRFALEFATIEEVRQLLVKAIRLFVQDKKPNETFHRG